MTDEQIFKLIGKIAFWVILAIVALSSIMTIPTGRKALITRFGAVNRTINKPGLALRVPFIESKIEYDTRTQTIKFDNAKKQDDYTETSSLFAASKDLQDIQIATVVNYHLNSSNIADIYTKYGRQAEYNKNIIEPIVRKTVKAVASQYTAEELVTKRAAFSDAIFKTLTEELSTRDGIVEAINIVNLEFSESFTKAIEQKVTQEQNALAEKNKLEAVKFQAEQKIAEAKGTAEALRIEGEAIRSNPEIVTLEAVKKWQGEVPMVMGTGSNLLFNIPTK